MVLQILYQESVSTLLVNFASGEPQLQLCLRNLQHQFIVVLIRIPVRHHFENAFYRMSLRICLQIDFPSRVGRRIEYRILHIAVGIFIGRQCIPQRDRVVCPEELMVIAQLIPEADVLTAFQHAALSYPG